MLRRDESALQQLSSSRQGAAYEPLHRALLEQERSGEPPRNAAGIIASVVDDPPARLRIPIGPVAERVFASLKIDRGERARRIALEAASAGWWIRGEEPE